MLIYLYCTVICLNPQKPQEFYPGLKFTALFVPAHKFSRGKMDRHEFKYDNISKIFFPGKKKKKKKEDPTDCSYTTAKGGKMMTVWYIVIFFIRMGAKTAHYQRVCWELLCWGCQRRLEASQVACKIHVMAAGLSVLSDKPGSQMSLLRDVLNCSKGELCGG